MAAISVATPNIAERENMLTRLLTLYYPKQRLRSNDKRLIKTILSLQQGSDGTRGRCCFCEKEGDVDTDLNLHHRDNIINHNELPNLALAHAPCNTRDFHRKPGVSDHASKSERKGEQGSRGSGRGDAGEPEWSSKEGQKHDAMRPKWNNWVNDPVNGPFKEGGGVGGRMRLRDLAGLAVHQLRMGSSVTYRRYIDEDRHGWFDVFLDQGIWWVEYRGPRPEDGGPT